MAINLHRYLNTINGLRAQDMDRDKPFKEFSDFQPAHQGVTGVISGGNLVLNRKKAIFCYVTHGVQPQSMFKHY